MKHKLIMVTLWALFIVSACNLNPQNGPTPTSTATATATPVPSPTAMDTPAPTPTTAPALVLQVADNYLLNGYFENAVSTYDVLLNQNAPADYAASAAFRLGQAALREGLFSNAVDSLNTFISTYPQDSRLAQAYFLRGDGYLGLSRWSEAIADLQLYLTMRPGLIDSYVYERIGDAQLALGQTDSALSSYDLALQAKRSLAPQLALRERVAQVYINLGRTADAVAQYDAILDAAQNRPYRASMDFAAAQALLSGGETKAGLDRMQLVFDSYSDLPQAYDAMKVLLDNGRELDDFAVGQVSFAYGDYDRALDAFDAYSSEHPLADIPAALYLMLGRAYREVGNSAAAVTAFQTLIEQYPQDPAFGEALLEQGRTKFLAGDIPGAIAQYLSIADTYDYLNDTAAEALWRAGYLYGTNDNPLQARETFERLASAYPDSDQARSGLFLAASAAVNLGEPARAEQYFSRVAATSSGESQAEAYLWVGRLALQRGDTRTADETLRLAIQSSPDSYFSARAQDLEQNRAPFAQPERYRFQFDDTAELASAEDWLRQTFKIDQTGALWPLSPALEADPNLIRGEELWTVGAYDDADTEFDDLTQHYASDGLASYQLAIHLRSIAAYRASIFAAANIIKTAGIATLDAPPYIARMRYPIYYLDVVMDVAQRWKIDPLLMFAMIRLESLFSTNATASAGEKGLMQVVPSTAEFIANQLNWPNYQPTDLFRPYVGITFGSYYLDEQLTRFDNNVPAALAGYNAGPGRASDWLALSGGDPDLFMTSITIDSTRQYVQLLYGFYNIYRELYGEAIGQ